ncbi:MAG: hypothetical protein ACRDQB_10740 [Thermocrispum sp.]
MTRRRVLVTLAAVVVVGLAFGVAAALGAFGGAGDAAARSAAQRYADALNAGSSRQLAAVTCSPPSPSQAKAFDTRAGASDLRWSVLTGPRIDGDVAHVTLRAKDGGQHRDYPFTLHRRDEAWCAHFNWSRLDSR